MTFRTAAILLAFTAGTALAHGGVKNQDVLARMEQMKQIGDSVRILADMARGKTAFDPASAAAARAALEKDAAAITESFRVPASDPKSEARPRIWTDWDGFAKEAEALASVAAGLDTSSPKMLRMGVQQLGRSCASCHETYRLEK